MKEEHMVSNSPTACQVWVLSKSVERAWGEHSNSFYPWFDPISCGWVVGEPKKRWKHFIHPYKTWFAAFPNKWEVRITAYIANLDLVKNKEGLQNFFFLDLVWVPIRLDGFGFKSAVSKSCVNLQLVLGTCQKDELSRQCAKSTNSGLESCHQKRGVVTWFSAKKLPTHMTTDQVILLFYSQKGLPTNGSNN